MNNEKITIKTFSKNEQENNLTIKTKLFQDLTSKKLSKKKIECIVSIILSKYIVTGKIGKMEEIEKIVNDFDGIEVNEAEVSAVYLALETMGLLEKTKKSSAKRFALFKSIYSRDN